MMLSLFDICREMGASRLVLHSGLQALNAVRSGSRATLLTDDELAAGARREVALLKEVAPIAADDGIVICVENNAPHLRERALLAQFGLPKSELARHMAGLLIPPIIQQLEDVNHPNVAMTLDVAHLYLAANLLDFDFLAAIDTAVPWVSHLHVNDNFGRLDHGYNALPDRLPFGEGDLHLPPGWGSIPLKEVFTRLSDYEGDLILEIKSLYWDYFSEARKNIQSI